MIPKIIHQIIFGEVPNRVIKTCLESWKILENYGFQIQVWNYTNASEFLIDKAQHVIPAFKTARNLGEASDIFRYIVISQLGGYYVDWDIKLRDSEMFLNLNDKYKNGILLIDPKNSNISCEFLSAKPGELFLFKVIEGIVETYNRQERELMNTPQYSGPYRLQQTLRKFNNSKQDIVRIKDVFELDYWEINHIVEATIPTRPMIHYWLHTWIQK